MKPEDYTPENICAALGVGQFAEPWRRGLPSRRLRVLLTPSFHCEVCITLEEQCDGAAAVSIASARTQFWSSNFGLADRDAGPMSRTFQSIEDEFGRALPIGPRGFITLDGMPTHIAYRSLTADVRVSTNPRAEEAMGSFLARVAKEAWEACTNDRVRNALADAGCYVGVELPRADLASEPARTTIAVIGGAEDRAEVMDALRAVSERKD